MQQLAKAGDWAAFRDRLRAAEASASVLQTAKQADLADQKRSSVRTIALNYDQCRRSTAAGRRTRATLHF